MSDQICVGAIAGAFGVNGEVRLKSFTASPEDIAIYSPLTTEDGKQSFEITLNHAIPNGFAARLSGVSTKEQADTLRGIRLFTARDRLPNLPDDEYYHADLIGVSVYDGGGTLLGTVKDVTNHGAGDMLEVQLPKSNDTVFLPFTNDAVPTVDLAAGRIVADPPDGLF